MAQSGGGKYDEVATMAMLQTGASALLLVVIDGIKGHGFTIQIDATTGISPAHLVKVLREVCDDIERPSAEAS